MDPVSLNYHVGYLRNSCGLNTRSLSLSEGEGQGEGGTKNTKGQPPFEDWPFVNFNSSL